LKKNHFFWGGRATDVLPPLPEFAHMNDQNIEKTNSSWNKGKGKLESLPEEQRGWIPELAANAARLADVVIALKEHGIDVSTATLSRFIRQDREKRLLDEGREIKETAVELAERGRTGVLREGTIEAVRQRLYERALVSNSPEEARELYAALIAEEAKLKQFELEARKVAVAEQQLKLQELRIQVEMNRTRRRATVTASQALAEGGGAADGEGSAGAVGEEGVTEGKAANAAVAQIAAGPSESEKRLRLLVSETLEVLNNAGLPFDKMNEARTRLAEGVKEIG
jgi:hypothetical protein